MMSESADHVIIMPMAAVADLASELGKRLEDIADGTSGERDEDGAEQIGAPGPPADFFIEAGVSGSVPLADRPEGQRLLAALQPGDVIVAAKLDRAFRSAAHALETLEELKKDKIGLHLIDLGGDVCGNGISKLVFTILSAVAENERDRIRERVRDAKRHRAERRLYNGGKRQFGWDVVDGRLVRTSLSRPRSPAQRHCEEQQSLRKMADTLASEFNLKKLDATSVKRILDRA
jgi:putative DNA-invertase from lambdoid prophage Rac